MKISLPSADQPLTRHNKTKSILSKNTQSRDHKISSEDVNTGKHELAELMNQNRASSTWTRRRRSVRMRRRRTTVATKHRERTSSAPQRPPENGDETDRMNHCRKANDQIHERSRSLKRWRTSEEHERDLTKTNQIWQWRTKDTYLIEKCESRSRMRTTLTDLKPRF